MNCAKSSVEPYGGECKSLPVRKELKSVACDKNSEIEKIKRQLYNLIDRVDALKEK